MKKIILIFFAAIFILSLVLVISKNTIAQFILAKGVKQAAGLDINTEKIDLGLLNSYISIKNLRIFNPDGFEERLMADVPQIYIVYDLGAFLKGSTHLYKIKLDLKEFIVVKNRYGKLNVNSISGLSKPLSQKKPDIKKPGIKIDLLELKIGRVLYKDYTQPAPAVLEYNINIDEEYRNITDVNALVQLIVAKALINTAVWKLVNMNFDNINNDFTDVVKTSLGAIQGVTKGMEDIFKFHSGR